MARRYTRLSKDEWDCLIDLYKTGVSTIPDLAVRYGVSTSSITQRVRSAGVKRLASFSPTTGIAAAASAIAGITLELPPPIGTGKPTTEDTERRVIETNNAALHGAMMIQKLLEVSLAAMVMPTNPVEIAATVRMLDQAAAVQERVNKVRRVVLRMDGFNQNADVVLPELPIRDMTSAEYKQIRLEQEKYDGLPTGIDAFDAQDLEDEPEPDDVVEDGDDDEPETPTTPASAVSAPPLGSIRVEAASWL